MPDFDKQSDKTAHQSDQALPFETRISQEEAMRKDTPQNAPIPTNQRQERYIEQDIFVDFSNAFSRGFEGVKATFNRMIDHSKAFLSGVLAQILVFIIPAKISLTPVFPLLTTYLGLIMLFPSRPNRFALGVGVIAGVITLLSGFWPLAPIIAGLVAAIVGTRDKEIDNQTFWITIPLALIMIAGSVATQPASFWNILPIPTLLGIGATTLFGLFAPKNIRRKLSYYFMNEAEKKAYQKEEQAIKEAMEAMKEAARLTAEKNAKYALFSRHIEILALIEKEVDHLPTDIADIIVDIGTSSIKIIQAIEKDPRDVLTGGRFLNRYLPLIQENVVRYRTIMEYAPQNPEALHEKTAKSLNGVRQAFEQITIELIENNQHDLNIDLNVMDKLIRSQGFEIKE